MSYRQIKSIDELKPGQTYHIIIKENKPYNLSNGSNASDHVYISGHIDNLVADFNPTTSSLSAQFIGVTWGHGIMDGYNVYNINNDTHGKLECDFSFDYNSDIHNISSATEDFLSIFYTTEEEDETYIQLTSLDQIVPGETYHIICEENTSYYPMYNIFGKISNIKTDMVANADTYQWPYDENDCYIGVTWKTGIMIKGYYYAITTNQHPRFEADFVPYNYWQFQNDPVTLSMFHIKVKKNVKSYLKRLADSLRDYYNITGAINPQFFHTYMPRVGSYGFQTNTTSGSSPSNVFFTATGSNSDTYITPNSSYHPRGYLWKPGEFLKVPAASINSSITTTNSSSNTCIPIVSSSGWFTSSTRIATINLTTGQEFGTGSTPGVQLNGGTLYVAGNGHIYSGSRYAHITSAEYVILEGNSLGVIIAPEYSANLNNGGTITGNSSGYIGASSTNPLANTGTVYLGQQTSTSTGSVYYKDYGQTAIQLVENGKIKKAYYSSAIGTDTSTTSGHPTIISASGEGYASSATTFNIIRIHSSYTLPNFTVYSGGTTSTISIYDATDTSSTYATVNNLYIGRTTSYKYGKIKAFDNYGYLGFDAQSTNNSSAYIGSSTYPVQNSGYVYLKHTGSYTGYVYSALYNYTHGLSTTKSWPIISHGSLNLNNTAETIRSSTSTTTPTTAAPLALSYTRVSGTNTSCVFTVNAYSGTAAATKGVYGYYATGVPDSGGYVVGKFTFTTTSSMIGLIITTFTSSEGLNWDYGVISKIDNTLSSSTTVDEKQAFVKCTSSMGYQNVFMPISGITEGSHFITVKYRKDTSGNGGFDTFVLMSISPVYCV